MSDDKPAKGMVILARGEEAGVEWVTAQAPVYGAVNGYVRVPDGHPWHGLDYDDIDVEAHGGLTYASGDWIGFDTLHMGDIWPDMPSAMPDDEWARHWTPDAVAREAAALARRVAEHVRLDTDPKEG